jgi:hypothetical protein
MAVENKICNDCSKSVVCSWYKTINKFDPDCTKNNVIETVIEIKDCPEFDEVKEIKGE